MACLKPDACGSNQENNLCVLLLCVVLVSLALCCYCYCYCGKTNCSTGTDKGLEVWYFWTPRIKAKWRTTSSDLCWRKCGSQTTTLTWKDAFDALKVALYASIVSVLQEDTGVLTVEQIFPTPPDSIDEKGHFTSQKTGVVGLLLRQSVSLFVSLCVFCEFELSLSNIKVKVKNHWSVSRPASPVLC